MNYNLQKLKRQGPTVNWYDFSTHDIIYLCVFKQLLRVTPISKRFQVERIGVIKRQWSPYYMVSINHQRLRTAL